MTDRRTASTITDTELDQLYRELDAARRMLDLNDLRLIDEMVATVEQHMDRATRAEAAIERVRALHQPVGVVAATEFGNPPDCAICGPNTWPCPTYNATTDDQPTPAATSATEPREHCGNLKPQFSESTERTECILRPGHQGSHADQHGTRWFWTDQEQPAD